MLKLFLHDTAPLYFINLLMLSVSLYMAKLATAAKGSSFILSHGEVKLLDPYRFGMYSSSLSSTSHFY